MLSWPLKSSIDFFFTKSCSIIKNFKAFTSACKLLICLAFVSFALKSIGCSLETGETGVVCVCVEAELADIGVRGWPGRGDVSSFAGVIVLSALHYQIVLPDCIITIFLLSKQFFKTWIHLEKRAFRFVQSFLLLLMLLDSWIYDGIANFTVPDASLFSSASFNLLLKKFLMENFIFCAALV